MSDNLMTAFKELMEEAHWMVMETKEKALEKAEAMTKFVTYPDWQLNKTAVEEYRKGIVLKDGYFDNFLEVTLFRKKSYTEAPMKPTDKEQWIMLLITVTICPASIIIFQFDKPSSPESSSQPYSEGMGPSIKIMKP